MFSPKPEQLEAWRKKIPVPPERVKLSSHVCEAHFDKQFIVDKHIIKIGDVVIEEKRGKKTLTSDAIPTIFPNCPKHCSTILPQKRRAIEKHANERPSKRLKKANDTNGLQEVSEVNDEVDQSASFASTLHANPKAFILPDTMWACVTNESSTIFISVSKDLKVEKSVEFSKACSDLSPIIHVNSIKIDMESTELDNEEALTSMLKDVHNLVPCPGSGIDNTRSNICLGILKTLARGNPTARCENCFKKRHALLKQKRSEQNQKKRKKIKVTKLQTKLNGMMKKYDEINDQKIHDITKDLPQRQQLAVQACISAAKAKKPCGRRYTQQWIYECVLLRIKSCSLYRKMIRDEVLALPSLRTIQRYMKKLKPAYGFIPQTFELLSTKCEDMKEDEKHGTILMDEMSLTSSLFFNKSSLTVDGLVNLGNHTPEAQKDQAGDHALVFMFKPFKGGWFQTVGAFLSKGAVDGPTLSKLSLEATVLLEQTGLKVDMWVCDGAPWNRVMWTEMGIKNPFAYKRPSRKKNTSTGKSSKISEAEETQENVATEVSREPVGLVHPCDDQRKMWMCSDFPHLIKRLKSRVCPNEKGISRDLKTPDGVVKFSHWKILYEVDSAKAIQVCHKLTKDHLYPHNYQSMNVGMAFSFFSKHVADAMEHYKDEGVPGLADCAPTVAFIRRINDLVTAMNSNTPWGSIRKKEVPAENVRNVPGGEDFQSKNAREIIESFIDYLYKWHEMPGKVIEKIPAQTHYGLYISLSSAIELSDYLIQSVGFEYVMTRRLNQDSLEHFFGAVRQACGCNSHPDPVQFIQVYRLLSVASLVKPPRGSNVTGGEMLDALLQSHDVLSETEKQKRLQFEKELDSLLDEGEPIDALDQVFETKNIDEKALRMFCGYVARKANRATVAKTCMDCFSKLKAPDGFTHDDNSLIERRSEGHLIIPSEELYDIIFKLEVVIVHTLESCHIHADILAEAVENAKNYEFKEVGCDTHKRTLTKAILLFNHQNDICLQAIQ
ncbi:Transposable element P transposase [Frankliniella fusca]|uniref:Transposable element P transposase n=1 Tax=Frankliniella fusca TaxID=407009 RepID=A0AAE1H8R7_9NEOP|nr:Transposable element P transposase [Frankliniella fusca]